VVSCDEEERSLRFTHFPGADGLEHLGVGALGGERAAKLVEAADGALVVELAELERWARRARRLRGITREMSSTWSNSPRGSRLHKPAAQGRARGCRAERPEDGKVA